MDQVNHFEIPFDDAERSEKFYKDVFDWKMNKIPEMDYTMVHTVETDEKHMPKEPGAINGGMYKRKDGVAKGPVIVITVDSIDSSMDKIKENGGEIVMEKTKVGEMGLYAQFKDPEGNVLGVWETLKKEEVKEVASEEKEASSESVSSESDSGSSVGESSGEVETEQGEENEKPEIVAP